MAAREDSNEARAGEAEAISDDESKDVARERKWLEQFKVELM
jgi:hypothetical protein